MAALFGRFCVRYAFIGPLFQARDHIVRHTFHSHRRAMIDLTRFINSDNYIATNETFK